MKFGQNLPRNQVPEWASSYIDYKALKKLIKAAKQETEQNGEEPDLAEFFYTLDRQLEDVDTFYNRKYAEFSRRLRLLFDRYGMASKLKDGMDQGDMEDLMGTLLELRGQYRHLQWYGDVNKRGFVKITKKLDKKIASSSTQSRYLATKVDPKAFATNNKLTLDMRSINEWLSNLGEVKVVSDSDSVHSGSSGSMHRMGSRTALKIATSALEAMELAAREDDPEKLLTLVAAATPNASETAERGLLLDLFQRAISFKSMRCIEAIIRKVPSIDREDDMNKRSCLHKLIIATGRARASQNAGGFDQISKTIAFINAAEPPVRVPGAFKVEERDPEQEPFKDDQAERVMDFILSTLSEEQRSAVMTKDIYGRMPLHYAAQYGLVFASQLLMKYMQDWHLFDLTEGIDSPIWQDLEGFAPLHLAVIGGHYRTSKALLLVDDWHNFTDHRLTSKHVEKSGLSLALATKSNFHKIVKLLVDAGVNVNYQDEQGETALHIAARFGHEDCASALLAPVNGERQVNLELAEKSYSWTPLFIASVNGHLPIVKALIDAGARINKVDSSQWTPKEHAALRGHMDVAKYLAQFTPPPSMNPSPDLAAQLSGSPPAASSLEDRRSNGAEREQPLKARVPEPVKSFGHRYLTDETMVLVSLGTLDEHKDISPISLENIAITDAHATQLDTALSLVVSAQGANGEPTVIDLPIQEEISTAFMTFTTKDPSKVKLLFDLVPTYSGSTNKRIARAVALLSSIKPGVGNKRMTLQTDLSVPLLAGPDFDVIGSINFNFLIITPFTHPALSISEEKTYWTKSSTMVIGHRGLGKNMATKTSLQLGENTIQSFITAANLGASYVEFDVQMTKDHVPVIYHDFLVSETGADVPVHTLTLEQFLALSETPRSTRPTTPAHSSTNSRSEQDYPDPRRPQRSYSLGGAPIPDKSKERMRHTRDFKIKGFKGNSRGDFIQSPFTTLEEMFKTIPEEVGFNIEMKYPMLFESVQEEMDTYAVELNSFVDTVLRMVYDLRKKRNIVFSSFHPDLCLLLTFKQPSIPVLFLTDAGCSPVGDIRASSLQEAIRFASRWNLLGIVSAAEPFVLCPRLINVVQSSELVCVSYGTLNNDPHNSNLQAQAGIDAVIVDSVARVRKGLTEAVAGSLKEEVGGGKTEETKSEVSDESDEQTLSKEREGRLELV
ncbi:glycerophosphocholine phosphodiesterase Gde1 like protein [Zymoseptoria brevis]|uniref:Glycerophosphocholine phosphodiesterase Gde1 like protein n=1 Tax=Zymoseptoria brevis TaxID=1047168 RepID=A0A0F4GDX5_9PEZI|nr:glycerophosphocholine phosphodiesterase Gde1 like protein [Zymoseptoria brevis]